MKKSVVVILVILVALCSIAYAAPQTFDLEMMSYDELLVLQQSVEQKMMAFPEWEGVMIPEGKYIVGTDIPEGTYLVSHSASKNGVVVYIYESKEDEASSDSNSFQEGDEKYLRLIAGNFIRVNFGSLYFKPFELGF